MPRAFDGTPVPEVVKIPCGEAHWDYGSECSYRCVNCGATLGSMAQPEHCKLLIDENVGSDEDLVKKRLGFKVEPFLKENES